MRIVRSLNSKKWHWVVCAFSIVLLTNCTKRENLPDKIASIRANLLNEPATAVKTLEALNTQHPDNPEILQLLSDAYVHLPGNNHLRAAVHLERAAKLIQGQKDTWLKAARLFAEAGDVSAQLENLCLHLQHYPNEDAWLDLGQILIQSDRQKDLEVAQQILFGEEADRPNAVQLKVLLVDLQQNNLLTEGSTAKGLQVVETLRLLEMQELPVVKEIIPTPPPPPPPSLPILQTTTTSATGATSPTGAIIASIPSIPFVAGKALGTNPEEQPAEVAVNLNNVEVIENTEPEESGTSSNTPAPTNSNQEPTSSENENVVTTVEVEDPVPPSNGVDHKTNATDTTATTQEIENEQPEVTSTDPPKENESQESVEPPVEPNNVEEEPEETDPIVLAQTAFDLKDYETASTLYWKAVRSDSDNPKLWFQLSRSFFRQDSLKKAEMMALEAARREPLNPEYVVHFLKVIREQKDPENYHAELKKARKLFPDEPFVIYELAVSYANTDSDLRAAILLFKEFLEKHPEHSLATSAKDSLDQLEP